MLVALQNSGFEITFFLLMKCDLKEMNIEWHQRPKHEKSFYLAFINKEWSLFAFSFSGFLLVKSDSRL